VLLFESEDAARQASDRVPGNLATGVNLEGVELREVVAQA
jgi:hypothetical protein